MLTRKKLNTRFFFFYAASYILSGARGGVVDKTLRHKPADRGFDSQWYHWYFSVT
jgi:lipoprotein signal peptidase